MAKKKKSAEEYRMIHVRLPAEVHRRMRIRAAEADITIQEYVARLITGAVGSRASSRGRNI